MNLFLVVDVVDDLQLVVNYIAIQRHCSAMQYLTKLCHTLGTIFKVLTCKIYLRLKSFMTRRYTISIIAYR